MNLLKLQNINTGYNKKQVLFNVDLTVNKGDSVLLVGPNGSGKSTLLRCIMGLVPLWKDSIGRKGRIEFHGESISCLPVSSYIKKGILYIPQKNSFFENLSVKENLKLSLVATHKKKSRKTEVDEILEKIPILKNLYNRSVNRLSGGERKLLSLGMVLGNNPSVLLYDEPLAGVSPKGIDQILELLYELKDNKVTLLIIEHRLKELFKFANDIKGMKNGTIVENKLNDLEKVKEFLL